MMILFTAACLMAVSAVTAYGGESCTVCHRVSVLGVHGKLPCLACHLDETKTLARPGAATGGARGCTGCHRGYAALFSHAMATRARERQFVARTFGTADSHFFEKNCNSCHLQDCLDCHGESGHRIGTATDDSCLDCHKGYYVGSDYRGMAPREDNMRYQRGAAANGETFLKMLPDVHFEAGLQCRDCHSMQSLIAGRKAAKNCRDCHLVDGDVIEHRIAAHMNKLECYACHSAWGAQEYGTFYLRFTDSPSRDDYDLRGDNREYVKSAYLKRQDAPPLGINSSGRVSPIRPEFIAFFTAIDHDRPVGTENRLLAAEWRAFFPHTVRRGTVMCEGCHDNPRRFILERPEERLYELRKDGLTLSSFWDRNGQRVVNGGFLPLERYKTMTKKSPAYYKAYVEKWKALVNRADISSPR
ncbi:MAG: hypothetical protein FD174_1329 [Geobacteraceae bacterium]|nr:MAG: hypothetical protein FD174_1329 [Geobacteraceae bacterium]